MPITGLHHIQIAMPAGGEEAARNFYARLLGIPEVPKPPERLPGGAWFESDVVRVHLGVDLEFGQARKAHPGLLVDGLHIIVARLQDAGYEVVQGEPMAGYDHVYVDDPFGNRVELLEAHRY